MEDPLTFNTGDTYVVEITNKVPAASTPSLGPFTSEATVDSNTLLDSSYNNKLINCNGTGVQLVITLALLASVPDNTQFMFIDEEGGTQSRLFFHCEVEPAVYA